MQLSWEAFLTRYRPMARVLAQSLARDPFDADDIVQDATVALYEAWNRDDQRFESAAHARNYFLRAVKNLARRSHRRAPERELVAEEPADAVDDPATEAVRHRQRLLGKLVLSLSADDRELVVRRFLERQTLIHIAAETGVPVSTLHSREKSLLERLREALERMEKDAAG